MTLTPHNTLLMVVDLQAKLVPLMWNTDTLLQQAARLISGCAQLDVPILVTEQYPQGLGPTVSTLLDVLPDKAIRLEKTHFGALDEPAVLEAFLSYQRPNILVCGIEAHICVYQTVQKLLTMGYSTFLVNDAVGARNAENQTIASQRLQQAGAQLSRVEMALFELLGTSTHPAFKAIQQLIR